MMPVTPPSSPVPVTDVPLTDVGAGKSALPPGAKGPNFGEVLLGQLQDVNQQHQTSEAAVTQLLKGESNNMHEVVLSVAQADLSIRLMLEIRNRLVESYQEIMRMQV